MLCQETIKTSTSEAVTDTAKNLKNATEELAESANAASTQAGEQVREIAKQTGAQPEATTNQTLNFLGIPIDINTIIHWGIDSGAASCFLLCLFSLLANG